MQTSRADQRHLKSLFNFLKQFNEKSSSVQADLINKSNVKHFRYLCEAVLNFLRDKRVICHNTRKNLAQYKPMIYKFVSKKVSIKKKKELMTSLKGLHILSFIIPRVIRKLSEIL